MTGAGCWVRAGCVLGAGLGTRVGEGQQSSFRCHGSLGAFFGRRLQDFRAVPVGIYLYAFVNVCVKSLMGYPSNCERTHKLSAYDCPSYIRLTLRRWKGPTQIKA